MSLNMTPLRLNVLKFLATKSDYFGEKSMVAELCPRTARSGGWTEQGLARMTGKVIKPLQEAGLVQTEPFVRICSMGVKITGAGRALLDEHDRASRQPEARL